LRALREDRWPGRKITQPQLAQALGGVSVPLISSWESQTNPRVPPLSRLDAYATLFATERSFDGTEAALISPQDLSEDERQVMNELKRDLAGLRSAALRASGEPMPVPLPESQRSGEIEDSLSSGPWRFADGNDITIVCAQWPKNMLSQIPYTDRDDPDYIDLLTYSELDALFELHGHLRAANPANLVRRRVADQLTPDDYTSHLTTLGGIDWNQVTSSTLQQLKLPVRQVADWTTEGGQYFEADDGGSVAQHRAVLEKSGAKVILRADVALFARAVSPFNRKRTVTICNGMYGRGTYGVVRALTDARFRDRNGDYLKNRFGNSSSYCILTRVPNVNGATLTPDWTVDEYKLFEWCE
jgi:transcriptional regulator with XRE-family HTH domain